MVNNTEFQNTGAKGEEVAAINKAKVRKTGKNKGILITGKYGRRVIEGIGYYDPDEIEDLKSLVRKSASRYGEAEAFKFKDKDDSIISRTYNDLSKDVDALGTALIKHGLKDRKIAIIGENRYEWSVAHFAIVNGTGVSVPLDKYLPVGEVLNLVGRSKATAIIYSPQYADMVTELAREKTSLEYFICMEKTQAGSAQPSENTADKSDACKECVFTDMPTLIAEGNDLILSGNRDFIDSKIDRKAMAMLLFTSGTTSASKGVMLSHSNIAANVSAVTSAIYAGPGDVHLSLLPLHHTFENTVGLMFMVHRGVCIAYCEGIRHVAKNLREYGVSILVVVPAILESMYKKLNEGIKKSGKENLFNIMSSVSGFLRIFGIDLRRKLFGKILSQIGPSLRLAVSGAAALDPEIEKGFDKIGLRVVQGYGLTEASPIVAANNDFENKTGTIGHPIRGVEVAIDMPDENGMGEIITRGKNVMLGYFEDPDATDAVIDKDKWLRTGDLGKIDRKGFITITGRAKSMIVFTNGKKAFPEEYETLLNAIPGVRESFAWGNEAPDGDIQICAKIVPDMENFREKGPIPSEEELGAAFSTAIKVINSSLPQYKIIRYFIMNDDEIIKTTTLKIKRNEERDRILNALGKADLDMRRASGNYLPTA